MGGEDDRARVDAAIGERIRARRVELGLTQDQLAGRLGVSYQQIQKYERGANGISASRLYALARRLDVAPGYFYADLDAPAECLEHGGRERSALAVARNYAAVRDDGVRTAVAGLLRAVVERQI
ncbi:MAG: helix-turn-helix domain-containing protein [Alphaproteobacteria bacterium]